MQKQYFFSSNKLAQIENEKVSKFSKINFSDSGVAIKNLIVWTEMIIQLRSSIQGDASFSISATDILHQNSDSISTCRFDAFCSNLSGS